MCPAAKLCCHLDAIVGRPLYDAARSATKNYTQNPAILPDMIGLDVSSFAGLSDNIDGCGHVTQR